MRDLLRSRQELAEAAAHAGAGNLQAAAALLDQVLAREPRNPDALQLLGLVARRNGQQERAIELFLESLRWQPGQPHVLNNLGNALLDREHVKEAVAAYRQATELQPDYSDALTNLGIALIRSGDTAEAVASLKRAVRMEPGNAKAWSALGRALRSGGRLDEAIAAFEKSLSLRPGHVPTLHNHAVALRLARRPEEAAAILAACAQRDPSPEIRYNLGHCHYDLGDLDEAARAYEAAVALDPANREAHDALNRLYFETGNDELYLRSYLAALQRSPNDPGLLCDLANRLSLGGRAADSVALLEEAISRGVDTADIRHRLGQASWAIGKRDQALDHYESAIAKDAGSTGPRLELSRSLIILGRYEAALETVRPVLEERPFDQEAIAYQQLAWRLAGDARAERLCDYERFVKARILQPPPGRGDVMSFNRQLEDVLAGLHRANRHPLEQTLRGGTQTMGNLFDESAPEIVILREMIEAAVADYIDSLPVDSQHVFLKRKGPFRISGSWSVRLRPQGFHVNHVHREGWISSCYYVGLPSSAHGPGEQGWIKFGETALGLGARERIGKVVQPQVGMLVLFPSYMYHGTIPFDGDGLRTTVAFDIVPAS